MKAFQMNNIFKLKDDGIYVSEVLNLINATGGIKEELLGALQIDDIKNDFIPINGAA